MLSSSFLENSNQSNINEGINNQDSREFINGTPGSINEAPISNNTNEFNNSSLVQNPFDSGLNSLPQQTQSAFSVVSSQSRPQREYQGMFYLLIILKY